jgi:hypothetical protein
MFITFLLLFFLTFLNLLLSLFDSISCNLDLYTSYYILSFIFYPILTPVDCSIFYVVQLSDGRYEYYIVHNNRNIYLTLYDHFLVYVGSSVMIEKLNKQCKYSNGEIVKICCCYIIPTKILAQKLFIYHSLRNDLSGSIGNFFVISGNKKYLLSQYLSNNPLQVTNLSLNKKCSTLLFFHSSLKLSDLFLLLDHYTLPFIFHRFDAAKWGKLYFLDSNYNNIIKIIVATIKYFNN